MTVLAALARYYDRLSERGEAPPFGYSIEKISFCICIDGTGRVREIVDLRRDDGKKRMPRSLAVPQSSKRPGTTPRSFFLWDKTSYALGVTAGDGKRTAREHEAFKALHYETLTRTEDPGLRALLNFLDRWTPEQFEAPLFPEEMKDTNIVFRLEAERSYLHERPAAKDFWNERNTAGQSKAILCLVNGERAPLARLHPAIKGVWGAQSAGASIVSFNLDAFTSYGHEQGANAPVGEPAAFAYTTALNRLLAKGSPNRIQIGDASTVFWAEAGDPDQAAVAEATFGGFFGMPIDEQMEAQKVRPILETVARGRPLADFDPQLAEGVTFYVLGLSPNAARLSVRFWFENAFGELADRIGAHRQDMALDPPPRDDRPPIWRLLVETASQRKNENVPPQLAGEFLRAILSGGRYPATLLANLLMRLRSDGDVNPLRVALLKAIVARNYRLDSHPVTEEPPVSYDPDCKDPGYLLGQLFALYEYAQTAALGRDINATIKDKFYGAAATTPQSVFPLLDRNSVPHLAKLRKLRRGQAIDIEKQIAETMERLSPAADPFPRALPPAQQALFALGYYHQRNRHFTKQTEAAVEETA